MENARAALYRRIDGIRAAWNAGSRHFDAFCIARSLAGVKLREARFSTPAFRGLLVTSPDKSRAIIVLNSLRSEEEQMFDLTHELVHYALHPPTTDSGLYDPGFEWEADEGASELLMPREVILEDMYICRESVRSRATLRAYARARAAHFGVTESRMRARMESLASDIRPALAGVPPEEIPLASPAVSQNTAARRFPSR
ncbi:MAG: ImmA/IrrE family metallo-endopeptidase [Eubacteriales bacterium]